MIKKILASLVVVMYSSLPLSAQLEFSNWLLQKNNVFSIDLNGNIVVKNIDCPISSKYAFCLSNYEGRYIMYGAPKSFYTITGQEFGREEASSSYFTNFAFKSPDAKYLYQLLSFERSNERNSPERNRHVCYIVPNDKEINNIKEVILSDTAIIQDYHYMFQGLTCAVPHSDGKRMWVITQQNDLRTIFSYLVDGEEITLAKISEVDDNFYVYYQFSKIVLPETGEIFFYNNFEKCYCYLKVNQTTGEVSSPIKLVNSENIPHLHFEISNDGKYLYVFDCNYVYRYLIEGLKNGKVECDKYDNPSPFDIRDNSNFFSMRLAIDGNIYFRTANDLCVIREASSPNPSIEIVMPLVKDNGYIKIQNFLREYFTFSITPSCDMTVSLSAMVSQQYSNISWDLGDGNILEGIDNLSHTYAVPGNYNVKMTVKFSDGNEISATKELQVDKIVDNKIEISSHSVCLGNSVDYYIESPNPKSKYIWSFSTLGTGEIVSHSENFDKITVNWNNVGNNKIFVYEVNEAGCSSETSSIDATVLENPEAEFDNSTLCYGEKLGVLLSGTPPFSIEYTLDGEFSTISDITKSPYQLPSASGKYELTKVSDKNCSSTVNKNNTAIVGDEMKTLIIKQK